MPVNELAISSSFSILLMYVSRVSLLAPGLAADTESAACTKTDTTEVASISP